MLIEGPKCNRRVTCDLNPNNARSESSVAANPTNARNLVAASKRFTNPSQYEFSVAPYFSFDGGISWREATIQIGAGWKGSSDPVVVFDSNGIAYLICLPFRFSQNQSPGKFIIGLGVAVYRSFNGGLNWTPPTMIDDFDPGVPELGDDKPWAAADANGNVYVVWQDVQPDGRTVLARFARTSDGGKSWGGVELHPTGGGPIVIDFSRMPPIASVSFASLPQVFVDPSGAVYVIFLTADAKSIHFVKSTDKGLNFSTPQTVAVVSSLFVADPNKHDETPILPPGNFRVGTFPTGYAVGSALVVTWEDFRDNRARIYFARSTDGGVNWSAPAPLLAGNVATTSDQHEFFPQLARTPDDILGCAMYVYSTSTALIDVVLAASSDQGASFGARVNATEQPWDPAVDAPNAERFADQTFIGDYFGLTASRLGFFPLWTDTRTGVQEIFTTRLAVNPTSVVIQTDILGGRTGKHFVTRAAVRRQPDVTYDETTDTLVNMANQNPKERTNSYVYALVHNTGSTVARNVTLAAVVCPLNLGVTYPQDLYPGDWLGNTAGRNNLGETAGVDLQPDQKHLFGPILWQLSRVPFNASHPEVLIEARCDNDDSGGAGGGCVPSLSTCPYTSDPRRYDNIAVLDEVVERQPTIGPVIPRPIPWPWWTWPPGKEAADIVLLPFEIGGAFLSARFIEVLFDKSASLALSPMALKLDERIHAPGGETTLKFLDPARVALRVDGHDLGEMHALAGSVWRPTHGVEDVVYGGRRQGDVWHFDHQSAGVGFSVVPGEVRRVTLAVALPPGAAEHSVSIAQRIDRKVVLGRTTLRITEHADD